MKILNDEWNYDSKNGTGINIKLSGDEVATAIDFYLQSEGVRVHGPRTITVNNVLCKIGNVYVDPSGHVVHKGERMSGRGCGQICFNVDCPALWANNVCTSSKYNECKARVEQ